MGISVSSGNPRAKETLVLDGQSVQFHSMRALSSGRSHDFGIESPQPLRIRPSINTTDDDHRHTVVDVRVAANIVP